MIAKFVHIKSNRLIYATASREGFNPDERAYRGLQNYLCHQIGMPVACFHPDDYRLVSHDDSLPGRRDKSLEG